jgi:hypothetical protein
MNGKKKSFKDLFLDLIVCLIFSFHERFNERFFLAIDGKSFVCCYVVLLQRGATRPQKKKMSEREEKSRKEINIQQEIRNPRPTKKTSLVTDTNSIEIKNRRRNQKLFLFSLFIYIFHEVYNNKSDLQLATKLFTLQCCNVPQWLGKSSIKIFDFTRAMKL